MASSPVRQSNDEPENFISPDSIRAMIDSVGINPIHEEASKELVCKLPKNLH